MVNGTQNAWAAYGSLLPQHLEEQQSYVGANQFIVKPPAVPRQRMRMNIIAIFVSLFLPWLLFTLLYADTSFRIHYKMPSLCWGLVALGAVLVLAIGASTVTNVMQMVHSSASYQPTWFIFLFLTSLGACFLGPLLGNKNFWDNMMPYYDLQNLNDYSGVDPTRMRGQQMMDAGRVEFLEGATIDLSRAFAFKNLDTYCVAPITMYNPQIGTPTPLTNYDFWAVGKNCCKEGKNSTHVVEFQCGAYKQTKAHEGLRLMADEDRSFMRLAVQQAESVHMIKAVHPLFFYWSSDALTEMHVYLENAFRNFAEAMCGFFVIQLGLVFLVSYTKSKLGYSSL